MKLHQQRGVAAVELALIMVPMLVLCFGIVEVGRALYYYNGLVKATRDAARYLTQQNLNTPTSFNAAKAIATSLAVCGKKTCGIADPSLVMGLDASKVTVTSYSNVLTGAGGISLVSVTISGVRFQPMLPYVFGSFASFPFGDTDGITITMAWSTT